jgi:hypothetical protein
MILLVNLKMRSNASHPAAGARRPAGGADVSSCSRGPTTRTTTTRPQAGSGSGPVPRSTRSATVTLTMQRCLFGRHSAWSLGMRLPSNSYTFTVSWTCSNLRARSWPRLLSSWLSLKNSPTTLIPRATSRRLRGGQTRKAKIMSRTRSPIILRSQVG